MTVDSIVCRNVTVRFNGKSDASTVLDQLDIQVPAGQIVSLLGPSGCGKSTLLRVAAGLLSPDEGSVTIDGSAPELARSRLSFIFQEAALLPWRSVWKNVRLPWELRQSPPSTLEQDIAHVLELVGFRQEDFHKMPSELSGGMKMRASIARALITRPEILLLDEPFAALDDMLRAKLNDLLLAIAAESRQTMLFVTHNIGEAIYMSHSIAVMSRGRIAELIPVFLSHPRGNAMRSTREFGEIYGRVSESLARSER